MALLLGGELKRQLGATIGCQILAPGARRFLGFGCLERPPGLRRVLRTMVTRHACLPWRGCYGSCCSSCANALRTKPHEGIGSRKAAARRLARKRSSKAWSAAAFSVVSSDRAAMRS